MRKRAWVGFAVCVLAALSGCREPVVHEGMSLRCGDDGPCPEGLRCHEGVCLRNTPPQGLSQDIVVSRVDTAVTLTALAQDAEGDPLTFTWRQLDGPEPFVLQDTHEGDSLTITPTQVGLHTFEVIPHDPYDSGTPALVLLQSEPELDAIYVATHGSDDTHCGSFLTPCSTLELGILRMRQEGLHSITLAAASSVLPYRQCLALADNEQILGCHDPITWHHLPDTRPQCRIECDAPTGHRLAGNAQLRDITLTSTAFPDDERVVTVWLDGGSPALFNVDVETAPCGTGCIAVGAVAVHSTGVFSGVNIRGTVVGFAPLEEMIGLYTLGGAPSFVGADAPRSVNDGLRGNISLSAPANRQAVGILSIRAGLTIADTVVQGGFAPALAGLVGFGGSVQASDSVIDLTAFGTRTMAGVQTRHCFDDGEPCQCQPDFEVCSTPALGEELIPQVSLDGNQIFLRSSSADIGMAPCAGVGVMIDSHKQGASIHHNAIAIGDGFTLAIGSFLGSNGTEGDTPNSLQGNTIQVGSSNVDALCTFFNEQQQGSELDAGSLGLVVHSDTGAQVFDNSVDVEGSATLAVALAAIRSTDILIEGNRLQSGTASQARGPHAAGALLMGSNSNEESVLARNDIVLNAGASSTYGVQVLGNPRWSIRNNFIRGGEGLYATGLEMIATQGAPDWPKVTHNTIYGGGKAGVTLESAALKLILFTLPMPTSSGLFANNLLDAGHGSGRRLLINNSAFSTHSLELSGGNIGQFNAEPQEGPMPTTIARARASVDGSTAIGDSEDAAPTTWQVLFAGSGRLTPIRMFNNELVEWDPAPVFGKPYRSWAGAAGTNDFLLTLQEEGIGVARLEGGLAQTVQLYQPGERKPADAVIAYGPDGGPPDIIFIETATEDSSAGAYMMPGLVGGGFGPPVSLGLEDIVGDLSELKLVASGPLGAHVFFVLGTRIVAYNQKRVVDLGSFVLAPEEDIKLLSIDYLKAFRLDRVSGSASLDIVIIGTASQGDNPAKDRQIFVFRNVLEQGWHSDESEGEQADDGWLATDFNAAPCSGVGAALAQVGFLNPLATPNEIAIACVNGAIEAYHLGIAASPTRQQLQLFMVLGPDIESTPGDISIVEGRGTDDNQVLVAYPENNSMVLYTIEKESFLVDAHIFHVKPTAVIRNRNTKHFEEDYDGSGLFAPNEGALHCPLALHGEDSDDLWLNTSDTSLCIDYADALDLEEPDDITGLGTRTDGEPDVGAHEAPPP